MEAGRGRAPEGGLGQELQLARRGPRQCVDAQSQRASRPHRVVQHHRLQRVDPIALRVRHGGPALRLVPPEIPSADDEVLPRAVRQDADVITRIEAPGADLVAAQAPLGQLDQLEAVAAGRVDPAGPLRDRLQSGIAGNDAPLVLSGLHADHLAGVHPPQVPRLVHRQAMDQAGRPGRRQLHLAEPAGRGVEPGHAVRGRRPEPALSVARHVEHGRRGQARGAGPMLRPAVADPAMDAARIGAQPQRPFRVEHQPAQRGLRQAVVLGPLAPAFAVPGGKAAGRQDEDVAVLVLGQAVVAIHPLPQRRRHDGEARRARRQPSQAPAAARPETAIARHEELPPHVFRQTLRRPPMLDAAIAPLAQLRAAAEPERLAALPHREQLLGAGLQLGDGHPLNHQRAAQRPRGGGGPEEPVFIDGVDPALPVQFQLLAGGDVQVLAVGLEQLRPGGAIAPVVAHEHAPFRQEPEAAAAVHASTV